jgi:hypothetical protein
MNIILGHENVKDIQDRYIVLELDTFRLRGRPPTTAYCLIENPPVNELLTLGSWIDLHNNLLKNYKKRDWKFCQEAVELLHGRWNGELNSFYKEMQSRINDYQRQEPPTDWDGILDR